MLALLRAMNEAYYTLILRNKVIKYHSNVIYLSNFI
jgi:hypothetical protein